MGNQVIFHFLCYILIFNKRPMVFFFIFLFKQAAALVETFLFSMYTVIQHKNIETHIKLGLSALIFSGDLNRAREYDKHLYKSSWLYFKSKSLYLSFTRTGAHIKSNFECKANPVLLISLPSETCLQQHFCELAAQHLIALGRSIFLHQSYSYFWDYLSSLILKTFF